MGRNNDCRLRTVIATNEEGEDQEYVMRQDMEKVCIDEARRRFTQAYTTPFYQQPLVGIFGYVGNIRTAEEVMNGRFEIPNDVD